jgi:hypothetical protein
VKVTRGRRGSLVEGEFLTTREIRAKLGRSSCGSHAWGEGWHPLDDEGRWGRSCVICGHFEAESRPAISSRKNGKGRRSA